MGMEGKSIRLPNKPEEYLKYVYGENCYSSKITVEDNYNNICSGEKKEYLDWDDNV